MCSRAFAAVIGSPSAFPGPMKKPISSSKSTILLGPKLGAGASSALDWPSGR
jgi:hypothetical protein